MLFADHFYHQITRKVIGAFGTIFNSITVVRQPNNVGDRPRKGIDKIRVPIAYGPKHKFIARIDEQKQFDDPKTAIKLPRMSFEITGLQYDSVSKVNKYSGQIIRNSQTVTKDIAFAPYSITIQLSVYAKTQDDGLQIVEQIIPAFQPQYTVRMQYLDDIDDSFDLPIVLESTSLDDDYEQDYQSKRAIIYTLDFSMRVRYFGPIDQGKIIRQADINLNDLNSRQVLEKIRTKALSSSNPQTEEEKETEREKATLNYFTLPPTGEFDIESVKGISEPTTPFIIGESIIEPDNQSMATVVDYQYDSDEQQITLTVNDADGYFQGGKQLTGVQSLNTFTIDDGTVIPPPNKWQTYYDQGIRTFDAISVTGTSDLQIGVGEVMVDEDNITTAEVLEYSYDSSAQQITLFMRAYTDRFYIGDIIKSVTTVGKSFEVAQITDYGP